MLIIIDSAVAQQYLAMPIEKPSQYLLRKACGVASSASVAPDVPPLPDVEQSESEATTDDDVEAWTLSMLIGVFFHST